jgi:hypothetical protein
MKTRKRKCVFDRNAAVETKEGTSEHEYRVNGGRFGDSVHRAATVK